MWTLINLRLWGLWWYKLVIAMLVTWRKIDLWGLLAWLPRLTDETQASGSLYLKGRKWIVSYLGFLLAVTKRVTKIIHLRKSGKKIILSHDLLFFMKKSQSRKPTQGSGGRNWSKWHGYMQLMVFLLPVAYLLHSLLFVDGNIHSELHLPTSVINQ